MPGHRVVVFGSLTKPGVFNDSSDLDVALMAPLPAMDPVTLTAL